jgi:predicted helicase
VSIVNGLDLPAIREDLSFKNRKAGNRKVRAASEEEHRLFERDPFIYFYEDYLAKYDATMRKSRGVYYTPPPIVNFIVRAIDETLKNAFGIGQGLADHKRVTVLDFACGTGTFLLEVLEKAFENAGGANSGKANQLVKEHLLKNIYGFEYLIAPYTIAHLKLSHYLEDRGHKLSSEERLLVFLTNTLEPMEPQKNFLLPALSDETRQAQAVKNQPILVITGNPPYSGHSKNKGSWITSAIDGYKYTVEVDDAGREFNKPLGEKNPKWLNDDYVKFIRFAQLKMDQVEEGIVAIITNHSWLENPTFRGMRQSLMRSFDQIYVLDLHGSTKPKETAPEGIHDSNVFDIQKGVAVSLFVKRKGLEKGVWRGDWWGTRIEKYEKGAELTMAQSFCERIFPGGEFLTFKASNAALRDQYSLNPKITEIFPLNVLGFQTHRDHFAIAFTESDIEKRISDLMNAGKPIAEIKSEYKLKDNRDWSVKGAREMLNATDPHKAISTCAYRLFDNRWCLFGEALMDYPRRELIDHVASRDNIAILVPRQIGLATWQHAFVADRPAESCLISNETKEQNYIFPLYLFAPAAGARLAKADLFGSNDPFEGKTRMENVAPKFRSWLDARYGQHTSTEELFGYIYAILYSNSYRNKYREFLRIDFPRVPFADSRAHFKSLAKLGWELAQVHLLRELPAYKLGVFRGNGSNDVLKIRYVPETQTLHINEQQSFAPVPPDTWEFQIGSYQVLEKFLKDRVGRKLLLDDLNVVESIVNVLAFTIKQMANIEKAYVAAFGV